MNFDLTEEQAMLKSLTERFVLDRYDVDDRRRYLGESAGFSLDNWSLLAELGILSAALPEAAGGLDLDLTSIAVISEALGHGMVVEPVVECAFYAAPLLLTGGSPAVVEAWGEALASGQKRVALAHLEKGSRGGSTWIETSVSRNGSGLILNGSKPFVAAGHDADGYVVSARSEGQSGDEEGWALYFIPADSPGLSRTSWRRADGATSASLTFDNVSVPTENALSGGVQLMRAAELRFSLARTAEAIGIMERLFAETLEYVRQRKQFGTPIGKFQAVQHRLAHQYAEIEQARALMELAIVSEGSESFAAAVDGARAFVASASLTLGHEAIQLHGGMGVTDELAIGHGHKRLLVISRWPDNADAALDRYAGVA